MRAPIAPPWSLEPAKFGSVCAFVVMAAQEFSVSCNAISQQLVDAELKKYKKTELQDILKKALNILEKKNLKCYLPAK